MEVEGHGCPAFLQLPLDLLKSDPQGYEVVHTGGNLVMLIQGEKG